jgi:hypothetical protein
MCADRRTTAVLAVPLRAIGTAGRGTIRLTATTTAEVSEWLMSLVRRHLTGATA